MPGRFFGPNRPTLESMRSHARGGSSINAVASALALRLHGFRNPQPTKPSGEERRITSPPGIALSKTKMPQKPAGRESRFCRLPIHRHEAGISGKREEDRHRRRADQQRGPDRALVRQRCGSKHRHLPGQRHAKRQAVLPALYERLAESKWPMGMHCQPIDFDHALMVADS